MKKPRVNVTLNKKKFITEEQKKKTRINRDMPYSSMERLNFTKIKFP